MHALSGEMLKIVFENPEQKPRPELAKVYSSIINSNLEGEKCPDHDEPAGFELVFTEPNMYVVNVTACCQEFKESVETKISRMLS